MDHIIKSLLCSRQQRQLNPTKENPLLTTSVTRWQNQKQPNFLKSCLKCRTNSFYFKSDAFQKAQTVFQIFGLLLLKNLLPKLLKIAQSGRAAVTTHNQRPNRITGHAKLMIVLLLTHSLIRSLTNNPTSVIRKKSPNVYKSCPKMISLEK